MSHTFTFNIGKIKTSVDKEKVCVLIINWPDTFLSGLIYFLFYIFLYSTCF